MRTVPLTALGISILLATAGQAWAVTSCQTVGNGDPAPTTAPIYTCENGATTFPGQTFGTVGTAAGDVDQIGSLANYNGGGGGAFVNTNGANPSIYTFTWTGGYLDIVGEVGNNGSITDGLDMEFDNSTGTQEVTGSTSLYFPQTPPAGTMNFNPQTLYSGNLAAGSYSIDTFASSVDNATGDPDYQINFSETQTAATPEPSSLFLLGTGLLGLCILVRRQLTA